MRRPPQTELSSQSRNISCTEPEGWGSDAPSLPLAVEKPQQLMGGCTANGLWTTNFSLLINFGVNILDLGSSRLFVILKSPDKTLQVCAAWLFCSFQTPYGLCCSIYLFAFCCIWELWEFCCTISHLKSLGSICFTGFSSSLISYARMK